MRISLRDWLRWVPLILQRPTRSRAAREPFQPRRARRFTPRLHPLESRTMLTGDLCAEDDNVSAHDLTQPLMIDVLANDTFTDPPAVSFNGGMTDIMTTAGVPVSIDSTTQEINYDWTALTEIESTFSDTFDYEIDDGQGGTGTATVTITLENDAPVANNINVSSHDLSTALIIDTLSGITDSDGDQLTVSFDGNGMQDITTDAGVSVSIDTSTQEIIYD